jgi:hypothetical protein
MEYLYLTEGKVGISYFEDHDFALTPTAFAPPAPDVLLSDALAAARCVFLTLPVGWGDPQHPSPRNQIAFCLSGRGRIEAGNGETRVFGSGTTWWMADTTGSGHKTTVLGDEAVKLAIVQLAE